MIALTSMTRSLASLGPPAVFLGLLLKVTLLFATASLVATLYRRRAAATRHFVWLLALAGALAVAALTPIAPRLEVVLPRLAGPPRSLAATSVPSAGSWLDRERTRSGSWEALNDVGDAAPRRAASRPAASGMSFLAPLRELWRLASRALLSLWLAGFLAVLAWSALGRLALSRLVRDAVPVEASEWRALLAGARAVAASPRGVRVAWSERVGAPLMWGWLRPVILLPHEAREWPAERRRDALLHELAHVTRGDYLAQTLATFACAVFWFHPLAWHAATRLRSECEHACDDIVLGAGTAAAEYATSLLEVARSARALSGAGFVAVGMARRSHLEGRLLAVLDESRVRASLSRRACAAGLAIAALLLVPLAGLAPRLAAAVAADAPAARKPATTRGSNLTGAVSDAESARNVAATSATTRATSPARSSSTAAPTPGSTAAAAPGTTPAASSSPTAWAASRARSITTTTISTSDDDAPDRAYRTRDDRTQAKSEHELDARPGETLELDLETGGAVEVRAWDEPKVAVQAKLAGRDWSGTRVSAERTETGVRVHAWQQAPHGSFSTSHAFAIRVPARYDVRLRSAGGDVAIVGLEGTFRGLTGGGGILLEQDHGRAWLTTGGGSIDVTDCELDGRVSTGGGAVRIERTRGSLVGSSGGGIVRSADGGVGDESRAGSEDEAADGSGGDVRVAEPFGFSHAPVAGGPGFVRVNKAGGDVDLEEAPHGANVTTGGGDVHIGAAAGSVAVSTGGGSIDVGPVAGSVWAGTGAGSVTVRLADPHGEKQVVDVSSGTGKVVLELPRDLDARFELETAYTRGFGHATHIDSAWDLEQTRTQAWDDTQGTPRRYVRARGVIGGGRGLIRVRTVNGDIEVRRAR